MTVAVVFDSAGTLLNTYRVAKDISRQVLMPGIETTTLTFASLERVLIIIPSFQTYYHRLTGYASLLPFREQGWLWH